MTAAIIISLLSEFTVQLRCLVEGLGKGWPLLGKSKVPCQRFGNMKDHHFYTINPRVSECSDAVLFH